MNVRGHILGLLIASLAMLFCAPSADAGFVASGSTPQFAASAKFAVVAKGCKAPVPSSPTAHTPDWLQRVLVGVMQTGTSSMTATGTSSVSSPTSVAAVHDIEMPPRDDSGDSLAMGRSSLYASPDLGGLSPPPRSC